MQLMRVTEPMHVAQENEEQDSATRKKNIHINHAAVANIDLHIAILILKLF
jgi:hypothetical protein